MIPAFINTNKVYVVNERMYCTCGGFQRFGLPCRHMLHVYETLDKSWEPTKEDISVHWWSAYYQFGHQIDEDDQRISVILNELSIHEITGPFCPVHMYEHSPVLSNLSSEWDDFDSIIPKASNYMISQEIFADAMNMNGSFGMITLTNVVKDDHGNHDQVNLSDPYDLSQDFFRNSSTTQEMSVALIKKQQLHAYLSSSIKELYTSGSDLPKDRWVTLKNTIDNLVDENHKLQVKGKKKQSVGKFISSCIDDCKRTKTHGTNYHK